MAVESPATWYVSFEEKKVQPVKRTFLRKTITFRTEAEAKKFAKQKMTEAENVSAGTINPHVPKRIISPSQIAGWSDEL